jgi:hypothetical protein
MMNQLLLCQVVKHVGLQEDKQSSENLERDTWAAEELSERGKHKDTQAYRGLCRLVPFKHPHPAGDQAQNSR